jgi:hypothetical protein
MNGKPFTLSVIVASVIGAVSLVSAQIVKQEAVAAARYVAVQPAVRDPSVPVSTASPLDIDPRRMEAPPVESESSVDSTPETLVVSSSS